MTVSDLELTLATLTQMTSVTDRLTDTNREHYLHILRGKES